MSISVVVASLISAGSALGVGSVLGQWIGTARDRRESRASVLQALSAVETARWTSGMYEEETTKNYSLQEFLEFLRELQTSALIAGLPRSAVERYCDLALAARHESREDAEESGGHAYTAGSIDPDFSKVVRDAARTISGLCWTARGLRGLRWNVLMAPKLKQAIKQLSPPVQSRVSAAAGWGSI